MTGFGPTARLLEHNPIPKHPWLTPDVVREEIALLHLRGDDVHEFMVSLDDQPRYNGEIAQSLRREWTPPVDWS